MTATALDAGGEVAGSASRRRRAAPDPRELLAPRWPLQQRRPGAGEPERGAAATRRRSRCSRRPRSSVPTRRPQRRATRIGGACSSSTRVCRLMSTLDAEDGDGRGRTSRERRRSCSSAARASPADGGGGRSTTPARPRSRARSSALPAAACGCSAVARRRTRRGAAPDDRDDAERDLRFLGLVAMLDPPAPAGAPRPSPLCHRAGIRIIVVTGDNGARPPPPIARQVGHRRRGPRVVTGPSSTR